MLDHSTQISLYTNNLDLVIFEYSVDDVQFITRLPTQTIELWLFMRSSIE